MTARRLGALFESTLPSTPNLRRCYGQRASEISQVSALSSDTKKRFGMFSDQLGSDATSIWAAATSGSAAIAVHLLACLLARMFESPEAIAIWDEIVRKRKEIIEALFDETNTIELSTLQVTKQVIERSQLAEWDASARAWLRVADQCKRRQHTQLKLVVENVRLAVNEMSDTYVSVMEAWKNCLVDMENLLDGRPQQATRGDILLAVSAWHLYPDMVVVTSSDTHVEQRDPLFRKKGLLTVGLEPPQMREIGISWSLPLKYLRYYGDPVTQTSSLNLTDRSRLTVDEFILVVLGCVIARDCRGTDSETVIRGFCKIAKMVQAEADAGSEPALALIAGPAAASWLNILFKAAEKFENSVDSERLIAKRLVLLGQRYELTFLNTPPHPFLGLMVQGRFVGILAQEEDQIEYLRCVARNIIPRDYFAKVIIRYKYVIPGTHFWIWEYASAVPFPSTSRKRDAEGKTFPDFTQSQHCRWLNTSQVMCQGDSPETEEATALDSIQEELGGEARGFDTVQYLASRVQQLQSAETVHTNNVYYYKSFNVIRAHGDENFYTYRYGDKYSAALFAPDPSSFDGPDHFFQARDLYENVLSKDYDPKATVQIILSTLWSLSDFGYESRFYNDMRGIATAVKLYETLTNATINVQIFSRSLHRTEWLNELRYREQDASAEQHYREQDALAEQRYREQDALAEQRYREQDVSANDASEIHVDMYLSGIGLPYKMDRQIAFSCIALFETGREYLDLRGLSDVMAFSFEDSLYISAFLLRDPSTTNLDSGEILRVQGNIGRAGISYMVPPVNPLVRQVSISEWPCISEEKFNGTLLDTFKGSSLQIAFTEAVSPIHLGVGSRGTGAQIVQTLISLYDNGKWVADLDPWITTRNPTVSNLLPCNGHYDHTSEGSDHDSTSVDNWLQLLDMTNLSSTKIMQTKGNIEARFAAMCLAASLGVCSLMLPDDACWRCVYTKIEGDQNWTRDEQGPIVIG